MYLLGIAVGCADSSDRPSDEDVKRTFEANEEALAAVVQLCDGSPAIQAVRRAPRDTTYVRGYSPEPADEEVASRIWEVLEGLELKSVSCNRDHRIPKAPLATVNFSVYTRGLSVSGEAKGILYVTEAARRRAADEHQQMLASGELLPLPRQGWFIYFWQS